MAGFYGQATYACWPGVGDRGRCRGVGEGTASRVRAPCDVPVIDTVSVQQGRGRGEDP